MNKLMFLKLGLVGVVVAGLLLSSYALVLRETMPSDRDRILFIAERNNAFDLFLYGETIPFLVGPDGSRARTNLLSDLGIEYTGLYRDPSPTWSPDGNWIAFIETYRLTIMRADGSRRTVVATGRPSNPVWSPDGKQIVYLDARTDVRILDVSCFLRGEECAPYAPILGSGHYLSWSPDSKKIINGDTIQNADGSDKPQRWLPPGQACSRATISPDGTQFVLECVSGLAVMNADGTGFQSLTNDDSDWMPKWSPNGKRISFLSYREGLGSTIETGTDIIGRRTNALVVIDVDGANLMRLTFREDETINWYTWLPSSTNTSE